MKTKMLIILFTGMIMSISKPAVAQHLSSGSLPGSQEFYFPVSIPWNYPSISETDAGRILEESMVYDLLPVDSANYRILMKLENVPAEDHCEEMKPDFSAVCASDYKFINKPVAIQ